MKIRATDREGFRVAVPASRLSQIVGDVALNEVLLSLFDDTKPLTTCPACQWTLDRAIQSGLMGCGLCYTVLYPAWSRHTANLTED